MWDALFDSGLEVIRTNQWQRRAIFAGLFAALLFIHTGWVWLALVIAAFAICEFDVWLVRSRKPKE